MQLTSVCLALIVCPASKYKGRDTRCDKSRRHVAVTRRGDKSLRLHCCCDKSLVLSLSLRYVAQIQTSLNLCDRSQRQNSVAATMIFKCHTRRFAAATCRGDVSQRFVVSCVSALIVRNIICTRASLLTSASTTIRLLFTSIS